MSTHHLSPVLDFLGRHAPFAQMALEDQEYLAAHLEETYFPQGETVLMPDRGPANRFFIIKQGRIRGESKEGAPGREGAWELVEGECFPIGALLSKRPVRMVQRAAEDTFLLELPGECFHELYRRSPEFHNFCSRSLASLLDEAMRGVQRTMANHAAGDTSLNTQVATLIRRAPVSCTPETPLREALSRMDAEHVGSIVVVDEGQRPVGVFTLHDLLDRVVLPRLGLERPIRLAMSLEPATVVDSALAHEAALVIAERGHGHVCIVGDSGRLRGVLSERDLFSLQRVGLVNLSRAIPRAPSVRSLAALGRDVHRLIDQMLVQGASVEQATDIITLLNDHLTRRAIELSLAECGRPEVPFTWLAFGAEGRREQSLKSAQRNGILFELPAGGSAEAIRAALLPLARHINQTLAACGFPLGQDGGMAGDPTCCLSTEEWRGRFGAWLDQGDPAALREAATFFDFRPLWGDETPAEGLRSWLLEYAGSHRQTLRRMVENALAHRPPLGLIRDFVVEQGGDHPDTIDLRTHGVSPFIDAARCLALANGVAHTNTRDRLCRCGALGQCSEAEVDAWVDALHFIQLLRLRRQNELERLGQEPSDHLDPYALNDLERRILRESFRQARKLQGRLEESFQY